MDNLTHSLIGVLQARAITPHEREPAETRAILFASVIGNNLPDVDFIFPPLLRLFGHGPSLQKLDYLLHHRGHTHTALGGLALAAMLSMILVRALRLPRGGFIRVFGAAALGIGLHLFADSWNNYGVHPFWPLSNRWFYGDSIFIVEPLLIFTLLPLTLATIRTRWLKFLLAALALALLGYAWVARSTPQPVPLLMTLWLSAFLVLARVRPGPLVPALGAVAVLATFFGVGTIVREKLVFPGQKDLIITPSPGNPFCWRFLSLELEAPDTWRSRLGGLTLLPPGIGKLGDPLLCGITLDTDRTATLKAPPGSPEPSIGYVGIHEASLAEFRALARDDCRFSAALRFLRAPFWGTWNGEKVAGDLRYDRETGLGFSELPLLGECPSVMPPWRPPREDVLASGP